jgi:hypothetical protein
MKNIIQNKRKIGKPEFLTELELTYGYSHKDNVINEKISTILNSIVSRRPSPVFYANAWNAAFGDTSDITNDDVSNSIEYFSKIPKFNELKNDIAKRSDYEILICKIYRAIRIFYPLILVENEKYTCYEKQYSIIIADSYTLNTTLRDTQNIYLKHIEENKLDSYLARFISNIKYEFNCLEQKQKEISRAQYALLVMLLSSMCEYDRIIALNKSKLIMTGIISREPTKLMAHILCCIVYNILQGHTKYIKHKRKSDLRKFTAEIVNFISPRDENNVPYSLITLRSVQVALTGK